MLLVKIMAVALNHHGKDAKSVLAGMAFPLVANNILFLSFFNSLQ